MGHERRAGALSAGLGSYRWSRDECGLQPRRNLCGRREADGTATIWNVERLDKPKVLTLLRGLVKVTGVSFSADGKFVVTSSADGTARVWEAHSGRALNVFAATVAQS